jgi:hypothetical protein
MDTSAPLPLTEAEVHEAERELGISFPQEYRDYLIRVSAGGAVARLEKSEHGWWWVGNPRSRRGLLAVPFPEPDSYVEAGEALDAREPRAADFADDALYQAAWRAWDAEYEVFQDHKTAGAIIAQDNGCGFATLLVVTGPLAGTLWWDGRASCDLIVPLSLDHLRGRPVILGEWLRRGSWNLLPLGWGDSQAR